MGKVLHNKESTNEKRKNLRENQTKAEEKVWDKLRNRKLLGLKFRRQHGIGEYIVDFYCAEKKLVIEIDGDSHFTDDARLYDKNRTDYINACGIKVIRFSNEEIFKNLIEVMDEIEKKIKQ